MMRIRKNKREISRKKLLNHLETCQDNLKLTNLDTISEKVIKYLTDTDEKNKKDTEEVIRDFKSDIEKAKEEREKKLKEEIEELKEKKKNLEEQNKNNDGIGGKILGGI